MDRFEIAHIFRELGIFVELTDPNPKKGIAYRKAARSIELSEDFETLLKSDSLESISGIGKGISSMIHVIMEKGYLPYHHHLKKAVPASLLQLLFIPGLNTRKIRTLYEKLNISTLTELQQALEEKRLAGLEGFGPTFIYKLEKRVLEAISQGPSLLYAQAVVISKALINSLVDVAQRIESSGSLRRKLETIPELHLIAISENTDICLFRFIHHSFVEKLLTHTSDYAEVILKQGIKASLHLVKEQEFPYALLSTTGHPDHIEKLKHEAKIKDYILTEHTLTSLASNTNVHLNTEEEIYHALSLHYIPPELRENMGEIEYAKKHNFSDLIEYKDLKGTFHCHSIDSDGHNTIEEMALAAQDLGWSYIGISDHSKSSYQANGLSEERLISQIEQIRLLNNQFSSFRIFAGLECDILKDGQLDFGEDILKQLDFVIISIHRYFKEDKETKTNRLIKAIENPYTTMVGHLTGRLLKSREPYELDIPKIIDACIANHKIIELNAYPNRLDMDWRFWAQARNRGLKCSINPDAHSTKDLLHCRYGVSIARKGWLKKDDVINALPLNEVTAWLN